MTNIVRNTILILQRWTIVSALIFVGIGIPIFSGAQSVNHFQSKSDGLTSSPKNWLPNKDLAEFNPCSVFFKNHQITIEHSMRSICELTQLYGDGEVYVINGGTLLIDGDVEVFGNSMVQVSDGSTIVINGNLTISGNSDVVIDGLLTIQGSLITEGEGNICGIGKVEIGGRITGSNLCMDVELSPLKKLKLSIEPDIDNSYKLLWSSNLIGENGYFVASTSDNGMTFHEISREVISNMESGKNYSCDVNTDNMKTTYYRVVQYDKSDRILAVEVVVLNAKESLDGLCELEISPNPCVPSCIASLKECPNGNYLTQVLDARGNIITELIPYQKDDNSIKYHINKENFLLPGIYIINAKSENIDKSKRMIVK